MKPADSLPVKDSSVARLPHALLAVGDADERETLRSILTECGLQPIPCSTLKEAKASLTSDAISLAFCEDRLSDGDYADLLCAARSSGQRIPVVVCSRQLDLSVYLDAMELGAYDFMVRPYHKGDVAWIVQGALWKGGPRVIGAHN